MDTTYWGRNFGVMLFKDALTKENLLKYYVNQETNLLYKQGVLELQKRGTGMNFLRKMWRFLDRWNTLTGYFIGGVWLLFNGHFYNNGMVDIRYVYFFNISGILMLVLVALKILEKVLKKKKENTY